MRDEPVIYKPIVFTWLAIQLFASALLCADERSAPSFVHLRLEVPSPQASTDHVTVLTAMRHPAHQTLSPALVDLVAERFRILGEPIRIRLLQELQAGEKNVTELVAAVGSTQPNVSKHLRILQDAGMVGRQQKGNNVYCYIADPGVFELCDAVCTSLREQLATHSRVFAELERRSKG